MERDDPEIITNKKSKHQAGAATRLLLACFVALVMVTVIYEIILHNVPEGLSIRTWYEGLGLAGIMLWQFMVIAATVWISWKVFGGIEKKSARYIGRINIWIFCVMIIGYLALMWIGNLFAMDEEYVNENGSITVAHSNFLDETEYSLWEKEGFLYRRYIRESVGTNDTDPNRSIDEYLKEAYPERYEKPGGSYGQSTESDAMIEDFDDNEYADEQESANIVNDGLVAIYRKIAKTEESYSFKTSWGSHGDAEAILYEDESSVRFVRYDRQSNNEKCNLYVYYEVQKSADGSYSAGDAKILDIYAYEIETGQVISSGRQKWPDMGNEAYRKATGE